MPVPLAAPLAVLLLTAPAADAPPESAAAPSVGWSTRHLTDTFYAEGGTAADVDQDGHVDVIVGPMVYFGPDWTKHRQIHAGQPVSPTGYSEEFLTFAADLTDDGYPDVISIGFPGKAALWHENPGKAGGNDEAHGRDWRNDGQWKTHLLTPVVDNESPGFADVVGDETPEVIGQRDMMYGYFTAPEDPRRPWAFHPISQPKQGLQRYTHGLGVGDVDGDGRQDFLTKDGWLRQPENLEGDPLWEEHPHPFAGEAAQLYAFDVDGDGDNDVVASRHAHGYGLDWFEQTKGDAGQVEWTKHEIMGDDQNNAAADADGEPVLFSQLHALAVADMNGDGLTDLVTGKRFWAHGPKGDKDPGGDPVLYWFELTRPSGSAKSGEAKFVPHRIDANSGVGTQVHVADVNGDGKPDVVVGNKRGAFVSVQP
ncbi:FG-GAP repeat domain-containing protein [Alienimonas californiensis]|uniref:FG-GAP repeat protein n=1 Tax=Alienimonas californiensis TaxID=2527989 RepID=A0A517P5C0_9PLAN|nr:VCBS repeat-containing protein [Alienimonas californiensis]QDT14573.1 FG-GAP repeat protein [Alienimonas californiensis]